MKGVNIFLADGFEDIEALAVNDILRRGGVDSGLVSINDDPLVISSHGVQVFADCILDELSDSQDGTAADDFMIFPGGMPGSRNLASCSRLIELMNAHYAAGGSLAAICAAPGLVLSQLSGFDAGAGNLKGLAFTCYDGFETYLTERAALYNPQPAISCGRVITGRGPGSAHAFAFAVLEAVKGQDVAEKVCEAML